MVQPYNFGWIIYNVWKECKIIDSNNQMQITRNKNQEELHFLPKRLSKIIIIRMNDQKEDLLKYPRLIDCLY